MTVIVMLILAGVSLNALVGDNGIITNAQNANTKNEISILEEYLQEKYIEASTEYNAFIDANELEILRSKYSKLIYNPASITGLQYVLKNGNIYYLIDKENLPNDLKKNLKAGNCGIGLTGIDKYNEFSSFKDVYGVTSNLKVYYCSNGIDSLIGTSEELKDSPTRVAISKANSNELVTALTATYDWIKTDDEGNILAEKLDSILVLNLENINLINLQGLYNFSSMTTLNIKNSTLNSFSGIETAVLLTKLYLYNSYSNSYSDICNAVNLVSFLIENCPDSEIALKVGNGLSNSKLEKLAYFGIYNSKEVTNIDGVNLISSKTKDGIKYLYFSDNSLTGKATINNGFNNLLQLDFSHKSASFVNTELTELVLSSLPELQTFYGYYLKGLIEITGISAPKLWCWDTNYNVKLQSIEGLSNQSNIYELRCEQNQIPDLDFLSTNITTLRYLYLTSDLALKNISGLKNNTSLEYLKLNNCNNLGKDLDVSDGSTTGTYTTLPQNSATNCFSALSNNTSLRYLDVQNAYYVAYLSYLDNCPLTSLYLLGCKNIKISDLSSDNILKTKINNMNAARKSYPSYLSTALLTQDSNYFYLSQTEMNVSEFEALGNVTGLITFKFCVDYLVDVDGNRLNEANTNSKFNEILSNLTALKFVQIRLKNLSEITFVTNCSLCSLDIQTTKVGTHKTRNTDGTLSNEYDNGLKLLNKNVGESFYHLALSSNAPTDLSKIQQAISSIKDHKTSGGDADWVGLLADQTILDTLSSCSDITSFVISNTSGTYDLSNCTKLEYVYWRDSYTGGLMSLPDTSTRVDEDNNPIGFDLKSTTTSANRFSGGKACKSIYIDRVIRCDGNEWWNNFEGMKNSTTLKKITIYAYNSGEDTAVAKTIGSAKFNEIFSTCSNLEEIFVYLGIRDGSSFNSISGLSNLTKLKNLEFNYTAISTIPDLSASAASLTSIRIKNSCIADISGVDSINGALINLTTLDLYNNSVGDLSPTRSLTALTTLNVSTNSIKANTSSAMYGDVDNISILNYLYKEKAVKCTNINVSNNQLNNEDKARLIDGIVK